MSGALYFFVSFYRIFILNDKEVNLSCHNCHKMMKGIIVILVKIRK